MPMDRSRYPENWEAIAIAVKEVARWHCQHCGRPCRKPDESLFEFVVRMEGEDWPELDWVNHTAVSTICDAPGRFVLTVAHLDQDPSNNDPSNLRALCSVCHLRHDAPYREANRQAKRERDGQLSLLGGAIDG
ncbi:HNH endonuclease [Nodosilinea sp. AN01ver1]|uniref:HNH endonuclease signature motif containing protein n=1 Tax=Nodosilinea sp. AN01ver1 TaxID=3423362 RepID=UPI003D316CDC